MEQKRTPKRNQDHVKENITRQNWMLVLSIVSVSLTPSPLSSEDRRQCPRAVWWVEEAPAAMLVPGSAESCWTTAAAKQR